MDVAALVGNPNSGKTTLFNQLTGQKAHVGNWPGVTVEQHSGVLRGGGTVLTDLPGLYSMTAYSPEERVPRDFLLSGGARRVLNLADSRLLERSLYLTLQLLELGCGAILVLGMLDDAERIGWRIDRDALSRGLGMPVCDARDLPSLGRALQAHFPYKPPRYSALLESAVTEAAGLLGPLLQGKGGLRFRAIAALEGAEALEPALPPPLRLRLDDIRERLEKRAGQEASAYIAAERHRVIAAAMQAAVRAPAFPQRRDRRIDRFLLHRFLALPSFAAAMAFLFWCCFGGPGSILQQHMERWIASLSASLGAFLTAVEASDALTGLLCEGVMGGVGSVLCFLPQLAILFLGLAFLEECGYLARAAFLMDHGMRRIGLSGKAFVPLLMGFGCTTAAVPAARTLPSGEREHTVLLTPFCSCGAKFPIYALFARAFFPGHMILAVLTCYTLGILCGILYAKLLAGKGDERNKAPFLLELPSYRLPSLKNLLRQTWERCADFLEKAGTLIFVVSVGVWLLRHLAFQPFPCFVEEEASLFHSIGGWAAPFFAPLGFGSPEGAIAVLTGLASKESVVASLGVLCGSGGSMSALEGALRQIFTPLSAASFLAFCTLYTPCFSALCAMGRELHSGFSAVKAALLQTGIAYLAALLVYQGGRFLSALF